MLRLDLQRFGGRGGSSGASRGKSSSGGSAIPKVKKHTSSQIATMSRSMAVTAARSIFIRNNMRNGLSKAEATRRFDLLVGGNTTAQLKKYIKRYQ